MGNEIRVGMLHRHDSVLQAIEPVCDAPIISYGMSADPRLFVGAGRASFSGAVFVSGATQMIVFMLTLNSITLHWLADPSDKEVWNAIDAWDAAHRVDIILSGVVACHCRVPTNGMLAKELSELRPLAGKRPGRLFLLKALGVARQPLVGETSVMGSDQGCVSACVLLSPHLVSTVRALGIHIDTMSLWRSVDQRPSIRSSRLL